MSTKIFVVSAPSGTGKTTLNRRLVSEAQSLEFSVSLTTRPIRVGEMNHVNYHFVSKNELQEQIDKGRMLEWAEVFGNIYGTSLDEIERITSQGKDILLEIDVQGWQLAKTKVPEAISIFIIPPSMKELWERLSSRGTDAEEVKWRRILTARKELECAKHFSHFIINDDLEKAYEELRNIVLFRKEGRLNYEEGLLYCQNLITECDNSEWLAEIKSKYKLNQ